MNNTLRLCLGIGAILSSNLLTAQNRYEDYLQINHTEYDFGTITSKDSVVTTTFEISNITNYPIRIESVVQDCRCLDIEWSKLPIKPQEKGYVKVIYHLSDDFKPFHRTIGVQMSCLNEIINLQIKGNVTFSPKELKKKFQHHMKGIGFINKEYNFGYIPSNIDYESEFPICNYSKKAINLDVESKNNDLQLYVSPNPIPASSIAYLKYSYHSPQKPKSINITINLKRKKGKRSFNLTKYAFLGHVIPNRTETFVMPIVNTEYYLGEIKNSVDFIINISKTGEKPLTVLNIEAPKKFNILSNLPISLDGKEQDTITVRIKPTISLKKKHIDDILLFTNSQQSLIIRIKVHYNTSLFHTLNYYFHKREITS